MGDYQCVLMRTLKWGVQQEPSNQPVASVGKGRAPQHDGLGECRWVAAANRNSQGNVLSLKEVNFRIQNTERNTERVVWTYQSGAENDAEEHAWQFSSMKMVTPFPL